MDRISDEQLENLTEYWKRWGDMGHIYEKDTAIALTELRERRAADATLGVACATDSGIVK